MNYESMTDRELDALVLRRVFNSDDTEIEALESLQDTLGMGYSGAANNITHAFSVVEAMRERGWEISVRSDEDIWDVMLTKPITPIIPGRFIYSEAKSLPRAICIAALRALDE